MIDPPRPRAAARRAGGPSTRALGLVLLWASASSAAPASPLTAPAAPPADAPRAVVAQHPLEFVRTPKLAATELRRLRSEALRLLVATGARAADSAELESALATLGRRDCDASDACLAQLAQRTGARSAMYVSVDQDPTTGLVTAAGRLVSVGGEALTPRLETSVPAAPSAGARGFVAAARQALAVLTDQLAPGRRLEPPSGGGPRLTQPSPSAPPPPSITGTVQRLTPTMSWVATGTGAALAAGGGVLLGLAAADARALHLDGERNLAAGDVERYATARNRSSAGAALVATGAAVALAGVVGLVWGPRPEAQLKVAPSADQAFLSVSGRFP